MPRELLLCLWKFENRLIPVKAHIGANERGRQLDKLILFNKRLDLLILLSNEGGEHDFVWAADALPPLSFEILVRFVDEAVELTSERVNLTRAKQVF